MEEMVEFAVKTRQEHKLNLSLAHLQKERNGGTRSLVDLANEQIDSFVDISPKTFGFD